MQAPSGMLAGGRSYVAPCVAAARSLLEPCSREAPVSKIHVAQSAAVRMSAPRTYTGSALAVGSSWAQPRRFATVARKTSRRRHRCPNILTPPRHVHSDLLAVHCCILQCTGMALAVLRQGRGRAAEAIAIRKAAPRRCTKHDNLEAHAVERGTGGHIRRITNTQTLASPQLGRIRSDAAPTQQQCAKRLLDARLLQPDRAATPHTRTGAGISTDGDCAWLIMNASLRTSAALLAMARDTESLLAIRH